MAPHPLLIHSTLLLCQALWSGFHVFAKWSFGNFSAVGFTLFRLMFAVPAMLVLAYHRDARHDASLLIPPRHLWKRMLVAGLFQTSAFFFFLLGLKLSTAHLAALFSPSIVVYTLLFSAFFGIEKLNRSKVLGIAICLFGALVMVGGQSIVATILGTASADDGSPSTYAFGAVMFVCNTASYAMAVVVTKPVLSELPPITTTTWGFIVPLIAFGFIYPFNPNPKPVTDIEPMAWVAILYSAYMAGAMAFSLSNWAVKHTEPSLATMYIAVQPFTTSFFAFIFLGETITVYDVVGVLFVLLGMGLVVYMRHSEAVAAREAERYATLEEPAEATEGKSPPEQPAPVAVSEELVVEVAVGDNGVVEESIPTPRSRTHLALDTAAVQHSPRLGVPQWSRATDSIEIKDAT